MLITVRVIPRSRKNALEWENGTLKAHLSAPPVDGAANRALVELLAERLAVPRRTITIVRGLTGRQKTVEISELSPEEVAHRLQEQ